MRPYTEANTRDKWTEVTRDRFGVGDFVKFCLNSRAEDDDGEKTTTKTTKIYDKSNTKVTKSNSVFLTLIGPCILRYFYSKSNKMHQCLNFFLFLKNTLHVSDDLSVHHQEIMTVHTATGICQQELLTAR